MTRRIHGLWKPSKVDPELFKKISSKVDEIEDEYGMELYNAVRKTYGNVPYGLHYLLFPYEKPEELDYPRVRYEVNYENMHEYVEMYRRGFVNGEELLARIEKLAAAFYREYEFLEHFLMGIEDDYLDKYISELNKEKEE